MIKTLLVDDDDLNTAFLKTMLDKYCPLIEVVDTAGTVQDAIASLMLHQPDLLFLDIEIHEHNGFEVLKAVNMPEMYVIVVSAHEKYAFQAIKHQVIDYILKPVQIEELVLAYQRYLDVGRQQRLEETETKTTPLYLSVPKGDHMDVIPFASIEYVEASGRYSAIHTIHKQKFVSSKNLGELEKLLPQTTFLRIHKTYIININEIYSYLRTRAGCVIMKNGAEIPIGLEKKKYIAEILNL